MLFGDTPADEAPEEARRWAAFELEATLGEQVGGIWNCQEGQEKEKEGGVSGVAQT